MYIFLLLHGKVVSVFLLILTPKKLIIHGEDFPRKWWFVLHVGNRTSETTFLDSWSKRKFKQSSLNETSLSKLALLNYVSVQSLAGTVSRD